MYRTRPESAVPVTQQPGSNYCMNAMLHEMDIDVLRSSASRASRMLKQLANEQRLLILCKLLEGECSVSELSSHVGLAQSATSQHLAKLRDAGLLNTRRDAQSVYYRIDDEDAVRVLQTLCAIYQPDAMAEADSVCC